MRPNRTQPVSFPTVMTITAQPRTYQVVTYGCQMNVHDSERIAGLLESAGYTPMDEGQQADVVVFNTCAVRENADNRLYGNLGHLAPVKAGHPGMQIAVGGCMAQKDRGVITTGALGGRRLRHPQRRLAAGAAGAGADRRRRPRSRSGGAGGLPLDPADPPRLRVRGLGLDQRRLQQHLHLLHRAERCAARRPTGDPATSSPRSRRWSPRACRRSPCSARTSTRTASSSATGGLRQAAARLRGRSTGWSGSASPRRTRGLHRRRDRGHGRDAERDAELHMPLQSGLRPACCKAMRRSYRAERYLGIIDRVRPRCRRPRSPPTSSSASLGDRGGLRRDAARRQSALSSWSHVSSTVVPLGAGRILAAGRGVPVRAMVFRSSTSTRLLDVEPLAPPGSRPIQREHGARRGHGPGAAPPAPPRPLADTKSEIVAGERCRPAVLLIPFDYTDSNLLLPPPVGITGQVLTGLGLWRARPHPRRTRIDLRRQRIGQRGSVPDPTLRPGRTQRRPLADSPISSAARPGSKAA